MVYTFTTAIYPTWGASVFDFLHVENLPAVGILLTFIGLVYLAFSKKFVRLGADVEAILAEKDKRLAEKDEEIETITLDRDRWCTAAFQTAQRMQQVAQNNKRVIDTIERVVEPNARKPALKPTTDRRRGDDKPGTSDDAS